MLVQSSRSSHSSGGRRRGHRASKVGRWVHMIGALALILGLFLPLATVGQALAAPGGPTSAMSRLQSADDTVPPAPVQVAAVGDFQQALGCNSFDPYCQTTQLTNNNGIWTGVFSIPPGQYAWQIQAIAPDGNVYSYGQGGLGGGPQQVSVGDGDAGVYFELVTQTNEVYASPVGALYSVNVDGAAVALRPEGGQLSAVVSSPGGSATVQVFAGADPVGEPQGVQLNPGPNRLVFSQDGQLINVEGLSSGSVTIERLDASGAPLPGGCYQLRSGGSIVNQGCDADDGADGYTSMSFPNGVPGGAVSVVEVTPPDGAERIPDQELQLEPGDLFVSLQPQGSDDGQVIEGDGTEEATETAIDEDQTQTEEPTGAPGDFIVGLRDQNGAPIPGACFVLLQGDTQVAESCDAEPYDSGEFANNGTTGFFGVPSGTYTLRLTQAPDGATAEDVEVEILPGQQVTEEITAEAGQPTEADIETPEPTEEPTEQPTEDAGGEPATFTVTLLDQNGAPIGGACFQLVRDGSVAYESCDTEAWETAQFANNGNTGFFDVAPGSYTLRMASGPEGISVEERQVDIAPGSDETETITVEVSEPTVAPTESPEETATAEPTETPQPTDEADGPGNLTVRLVDDAGQPVGGACFALLDGGTQVAESCDTPERESAEFANNGNTGFFNVPSGTYDLEMTSGPEGVSVAPQEVEVAPGVETTVEVTAQVSTPTEEPSPTETALPTETAAPTDETQPSQPGPPGDLIVTLQDAQGVPIGGACFEIEMEGQPPIESCDADDPFPANGNTGFFGVPSGDYTLRQTTVPAGFNPIDERQITIQPGGNPNLLVTPGEGEQPSEPDEPDGQGGTLIADVSAVGGQDVCIQLNTTSGIGFVNPPTACDNGEGDAGDQPGEIELRNIEPGEYTLSVVSGADDVDDRTVTISESEPTRITLGQSAPEEPTTGTLTVTIVDEEGDEVGGACFDVTNPSGTYNFCDDGDGRMEIPDVVFGTQTISPVSVPQGYSLPAEQTVEVSADEPDAEVEFVLGQATGTVRVTTVGQDGNPLPDACYTIDDGDESCAQDDGVVIFENVPAGQHTVAQSEAPDGYQPVDPQTVDVEEGATAEVRFENARETGTIHVVIVDEDDNRLTGACISLDGADPICDVDEVGEFTFQNVPVGEHTVSQTTPPAGYGGAEDQTVDVDAGETVEVAFENELVTGTIRVVSEDASGADLPGACVSLDGGEPTCDVDGDGVLIFEQVPTGDHTVSQTAPPEGYLPADEQTVTVTAGQTVDVRFTNAPATGSIVATVLDEEGNPVDGVCVGYASEGGDPQTLCEPTDDGTYRFDGVAPGTYQVSVSQVPAGYVAPDPVQVDVIEGQDANVAFELTEAPPETGDAQLTLVSEDGQAAVGVCIGLVSQETGEQLGPYCDNGEGDNDATEGVLLLQGIPAGRYEVVFGDLNGLTSTGSTLQRLQDGEPIIIEIVAGETLQQEIVVPGLFVLGGIEARTVDASTGEPVPGACYTIGTTEPTVTCDGGEGDESPDAGTVLVTGLPQGDYTVSMSTPPDGYSGAPDQTATVTGGGTASLSFEVEAEVTTGSLTIRKLDGSGEVLPGACFRLWNASGTVAQACDDADGADDGTIVLDDLPAGTYQLTETRTPGSEYSPAPDRQVEITAGEDLEIEVVNSAAPGRLHVIKVDAADPSVRLEDACFRLDGATTYGPFCDGDDLNVDGRTVFTNVAPGTYTLVETEAPAGYDPAPNREVTIRAGVTLQITIQNQQTPPPPEAGTLVVNKLDADNETLAGGCFRLFDGDTPVTAQVCDITDGTNDGRIVFENVPVGTWTLRETLAPSPSYQIAPDQEVTIENRQTTEVDVVNRLKNGRILIKKVTPQGGPIEGACFQIVDVDAEPQCSNAKGEILFENVPVGTYTLEETRVPYGFREAEPVDNVRVNPGQTTVVTVENERQPPPNTGSVQVLKFVCPVDSADEERTSFLGGAAGNAELSRTKGCKPADAEFTLVGEDGSDGPGAFRTGEDGQYLTTVPAKVYRLDETNPDLPGNSAALLRVEVGRMTTVVVINYVAPPAPEPVNINVTKFTCQAGFNGTTFEDFAASCMNTSQLTNNITVRAQGPVSAKAVTGDGGQAGRTAFADLPAGTYTIYEERPYNIPTNYVFCGWNPNWPADFKSVNGAVTAELGEGEDFHCVLFNIPEPVTDSTGVILVRKYTCDVETPPKGYKFEEECRLSDEHQEFELKQFNEEMQDYGEGTRQTANPDGILRFIDLRPGSYQLREVDSSWCYANSNSVNTRGDVVVRAGQVSLVSIYNCVGTSAPPNTGSGDAADLISPQEPEAPAPGEPGVTPGIAWPVVALAAVLALRPRRVLAPGLQDEVRADGDRDAA